MRRWWFGARSSDIRRAAAGAPDHAARLEIAQALLLAAIVDGDPDNQNQHHPRYQRIRGHDEGGVGTERHRVTPLADWLASSAKRARGRAGCRCAWPPDAA